MRAFAISALLLLAAWIVAACQAVPALAQVAVPRQGDSLGNPGYADAPLSPQMQQMLLHYYRFLPGNEGTYYVLVLQNVSANGSVVNKDRKFVLCAGKETAAKALLTFYTTDTYARKKFEYRAFNNLAEAQVCANRLIAYSQQAGYRRR